MPLSTFEDLKRAYFLPPFGLTDDAVTLSCHLSAPVSDQSEVVAAAEAFLQEDGGAAATHLAVGDDGNAIT